MKSIYIAGPMRGRPLYNFPVFDAARDWLAGDGWCVVSPADLDRKSGFNEAQDEVNDEFLRAALERDVAALMGVDAIYMLKGWEESVGARAEYALARWRGLEVFFEFDSEKESVLEVALRVTSGDRRRDYDAATPNHERIAGAWNWYLRSRKDPDAPISALDVSTMMILLKVARACHTPTKDTYVDIAGYSRCCSQISGFEKE